MKCLGRKVKVAGRVSQFPCHCFRFLMVPDSCWCNVREAEVKGKPGVHGNKAIPFSLSLALHVRGSFMVNIFLKHTQREKGERMTWWGESAKLWRGKQTAERTLTQENISLPGPTIISPQSCVQASFSSHASAKEKSERCTQYWSDVHTPVSVSHSYPETENRLISLVNYVTVRGPDPLLPWPLPLMFCSVLSAVLGNMRVCGTWLLQWALPVAVITCLRPQWHLHATCLVPTVWSSLGALLEKDIKILQSSINTEMLKVKEQEPGFTDVGMIKRRPKWLMLLCMWTVS